MMRFFLLFLIASVAMFASGKALLPSQVHRKGLTNEQIAKLLEKYPNHSIRLTPREWRAIQYELSRYHNMTNFVDTITSSNGFSVALCEAVDTAKSEEKKRKHAEGKLALHEETIEKEREKREKAERKAREKIEKELKKLEKKGVDVSAIRSALDADGE